MLAIEATPDGILLRPVEEPEVEIYTPHWQAEFLLTNTVTDEDSAWAVAEGRKMGLDPDTIPQHKPHS